MSLYLLIDIIIIIFPLLLSLIPWFGFYRKLLPLSVSILAVGGLFLVWDILVTARGDWAFNPLHVGNISFLGLPVEEVLFFVVVPYSCIFLYEGLAGFMPDRRLPHVPFYYMIAALVFIVSAVFFSGKEYTSLVMLVTGLTLIAGASFFREMYSSMLAWLWLLCGMALFFIFNYFLTAAPVVTYAPTAILNLRIATIPIEDFLYNFCLLSWYLGVYLAAKKNFKKKCPDEINISNYGKSGSR
ncbi:MAG: lycopene cyclase domain-containing protein [Candidatus Saganbacteria bacterium]|nr:lycopene cyclase domain-containing protein [Candidatus Saganbacteria bacterium]